MKNYEKLYKMALERAKDMLSYKEVRLEDMEYLFPELKESEDERIRKAIICGMYALKDHHKTCFASIPIDNVIAWLEKQGEPSDKGEISDGFHTFNELYYYRMLYNAAFFNMLPKEWVHKSKKHNNGEDCFGGGWFIVMANLPTGQISNHYEIKDWDLFQIPEKEKADKWDGHTPQEAAERLHNFLLEKQSEQKTTAEIFPELAESGDERIRKSLIRFLKSPFVNNNIADEKVIPWLDWLEKQGEIDKISYDIAENEKREFVGNGFIKCYADFQDFKEGETYWLEYLGNDNYNVRSDNLLGKTYHITPCQLYTIFMIQTWFEWQGEHKETLCGKCKKAHPSHFCQDITALGRCALEKQGEQKSIDKGEYEHGYEACIKNAVKFLKSYRRDSPDGTGYIPGIVDDQTIEDFEKTLRLKKYG